MDKSDSNDRTSKSPKKGYKFRQSTKDNSKNKKIKNRYIPSDSDSDSDYDPDEDMYLLDEESSDSEEEEFNAREFQKFVQKRFPSKSGMERVKQLEKIDEMIEKKKINSKNKKISGKTKTV